MKSIHLLAAMVVLASFAQVGEASLFDQMRCRKAAKCCDCAPTCQPDCCKPVIVRPCHRNVYTHQRACSTLKRPCCDNCCAPVGCAPCCPTNGCCDTGCGNGCCDAGCGNGCCDTGCGNGCCDAGCGNGCCDTGCCDTGCCDIGCCDDVCCDDSCRLAELIYDSQTACYARQRRRALSRLSNRYDCVCYPEVMCALIYGLNDSDERVRSMAAKEIGDQLRKNSCCCCQKVVSALTCALADCHLPVRFWAKRALKQCGYQVVKPCYDDCCCDIGCCDVNCCPTGCNTEYATPVDGYAAPVDGSAAPAAPADLPIGEQAAPQAIPQAAPAAPPAPAAAPAEEAAPAPPSAYFPKYYPRHSSVRPVRAKRGLAGLLGLAN